MTTANQTLCMFMKFVSSMIDEKDNCTGKPT